MSSLSLSLKLMLAASALAGLTLLACGDDPAATPAKTSGDDTTNKDAGSKKDAGSTKDAGSKKDAGIVIPQAEPGDDCEGTARAQCTGCDQEPCFTTCEDGTYGECKSLTGALGALRDAGGKISTDAGEFSASDGQVSVKFGDSSVVIPPMACPAPLVCSSTSMALSGALISSLAGGAAACIANDAVGFPPTCSTAAECTTAGLKLSQCLMGYCIQICK